MTSNNSDDPISYSKEIFMGSGDLDVCVPLPLTSNNKLNGRLSTIGCFSSQSSQFAPKFSLEGELTRHSYPTAYPSHFYEPRNISNSCLFPEFFQPYVLTSRYPTLNSEEETEKLFYTLRTVPHLYTICNDDLMTCAKHILRREFGSGDEILAIGQMVSHVYIVLMGTVEAYREDDKRELMNAEDNTSNTNPWSQETPMESRVGTIMPGDTFCIDNIVFREPSNFLYRSGSSKTVLGLLPAKIFDEVMDKNLAFRQSVARKLADHMNIFTCFKDFCRQIFSHQSAKNEYLPIWNILDSYYRLNNSIHDGMHSSEVDTGAWNYATKRLPDNVITTFCFDLTRALPPFLAKRMQILAKSPDSAKGSHDVKYIATKERRRCSWQLGMEGKTLVLLRDGFTDLIDFITNLCIHIIESNKLRGRLQGMVHPPAIDILDEVLHGSTSDYSTSFQYKCSSADSISAAKRHEVTKEVLAKMPLTEKEKQGLLRIWPHNCLENIYTIIMHREEYMLRMDASNSRRFQTDPFHEWSLNLRAAVMRKMKLTPNGRLPDDLVIDIVSSNTHCTKSILSSFSRKHMSSIIDYVKNKRPELANLKWSVQEDMIYAALTDFIEDANLKDAYIEALQNCGIEVIQDTAMTGLQVDIVPVSKVDLRMADTALSKRNCFVLNSHHFILNMDFAFGAQADGITQTLVETFGHHIRSFNVMGKAGGFANSMRRGAIQIASHVLLSKASMTMEDYLDELRSCGNEDITPQFLTELLGEESDIQIFNGVVLTVPGTMLQNTKLLTYYSKMWHCIGLEMEGSYFCRTIKECVKAGLLKKGIKTRFVYYTSDLPLQSAKGDVSLIAPMKPNEGVPPLYCIARAFLIKILNGDEIKIEKVK